MPHPALQAAPETAVRLGSQQLLDSCCRHLSRNQATLEDFITSEDPLGATADADLTTDATRLARAFALMDSAGPLGATAVRMFTRIWRSGRHDLRSERDTDLFAQLLLINDPRHPLADELRELVTPEIARELSADLLHPERGGPADHRDWIRAFSMAVGMECEVPEAAWTSGESDPFDHVTFGDVEDPQYDGPLVTSITACYRPDDKLISAIRSLCRQSWGNLEIIVLDDGSGPDFEPILATVADMDPRIRMVRNTENRGTYRRRNQGIDLARGRYITFHDADDISAPNRIYDHATVMEGDPSLAATLSSCAKVEPRLQVTRPGYVSRAANAQSLMLRASSVLPRLGYFHEVRRGGDGEYHRRIVACFGEEAVRKLSSSPLMLYRRTPGSLSSTDFSPGRRSRRRWAYQMVTSHQHRTVKHPSQYFVTQKRARSSRDVPVANVIKQAHAASHTFDVAYLADFRDCNPALDRLWDEAQGWMTRGLSVAIAQCDRTSLLSRVDGPLAPKILAALDRGAVKMLVDDSAALVTHLVVEDAHALTIGLLPQAAWTICSAEVRGDPRVAEAGQDHLPPLAEPDAVLRQLGARTVVMGATCHPA